MTTSPPRAAIYARVSTKGQDVGLQMAELRQVAAQRSWRVVDAYVDEAISGTKDRRPELDRMMRDARTGKLDVVAVWKFDRFARSTSHLVNALEEFQALGVDFVSLREQVDTTTPMGKAMFTIIAAVSELEKDLIRERVNAGIARAKAKGVQLGRPRCAVTPRQARNAVATHGSIRKAAKALGVSVGLVADRLKAAQDGCSENPSAGAVEKVG